MRNLQDYIRKYNEIVNNLGYQGQGIEVLVQLLANASYISEVENASYMQEASLEKAALENSKIQRCIDMMYSVYRGKCPRVLMKIRPTSYIKLIPNQEKPIIESQTFKLFYTGYYSIKAIRDNNRDIYKNVDNLEFLPIHPGERRKFSPGSIIEGSLILSPAIEESDTYIIECLISPTSPIQVGAKLTEFNNFYIESLEDNLSNDVCVKINGENVSVTRTFADHIINPSHVFDLTLPNYGSRIYLANYDRNEPNTQVSALWYKFSNLARYNPSELKKIKFADGELVEFNNDFLTKKNYNNENNTLGLVFISESERANTRTIHYKANRDRYVNSIIRSNSDVGRVLEEKFPDQIVTGGTTYKFAISNGQENSSLTIYYIPKNPESETLDNIRLDSFRSECRAYYIITNDIDVQPGTKYKAVFDITLELYNNSETDWKVEIGDKLLKVEYEKKFGVKFDEEYIKSLISKYSNIKKILGLNITCYDSVGNKLDSVNEIPEERLDISYFEIQTNITSIIR